MPCEVSFLWTTDQLMAGYNQQFRGKTGPTNVLSFPSYTRQDLERQAQSSASSLLSPLPLGDVVVALETVHKQAQDAQIPVWHHLVHLVIHGVLHLVGYDHEQDEEADEMERLETRLLARWGIDDPYVHTGSYTIHHDHSHNDN
jgi:probable rRNA maturation factor